jgi:predicted peroxiredoxin
MVSFKINSAEYKRAIKEMKGLSAKQTDKEYAKIIRNGSRTMVADMKLNAPTADNDNIERNVGITTASKWTKTGSGARIGVVKK